MVRTADLPDLGAVTDGSLFVADRSGSGAFRATALRDYVGSDAEVAAAANTGRNKLHNARFNIWQRSGGPFTSGYTADRWQLGATNPDNSVTFVPASDADRTGIGDEAVQNLLQDTVTGTASAGAYSYIGQSIEYVQRLSGKTVTLSFWARATSGTPKLGINALQSFGTGGSPSPGVWALSIGIAVTLSTTWTRYTATIALPSAIGKTLGSNLNDYTTIALFTSAASGAAAALSGNIGVQSFTFQLWGMQLEIGSTATDLERIEPQVDIANCQRFFQVFYNCGMQAYGAAGQGLTTADYILLVVLRSSTPTVTLSNQTYTNGSGLTPNSFSGQRVRLAWTVTATGISQVTWDMTISADL